MVLVEARVLRGDYSVLEIGRDLAERNEFAALVIRSVMDPGLHVALESVVLVNKCPPESNTGKESFTIPAFLAREVPR